VLTAARKASCAVRIAISPTGEIVVTAAAGEAPPTEGQNPWAAATRELIESSK
jgi:hypothetical protein